MYIPFVSELCETHIVFCYGRFCADDFLLQMDSIFFSFTLLMSCGLAKKRKSSVSQIVHPVFSSLDIVWLWQDDAKKASGGALNRNAFGGS